MEILPNPATERDPERADLVTVASQLGSPSPLRLLWRSRTRTESALAFVNQRLPAIKIFTKRINPRTTAVHKRKNHNANPSEPKQNPAKPCQIRAIEDILVVARASRRAASTSRSKFLPSTRLNRNSGLERRRDGVGALTNATPEIRYDCNHAMPLEISTFQRFRSSSYTRRRAPNRPVPGF